jgi:hypothetical protein
MVFLLCGCNDTPNSVGRGSQNKEDYGVVHIDTFYATAHSSLPNLLFTFSSDRFMLGKYKTYQAWACLKFYSWPDSMIGAKITSATIQLKGVYHFGDSLSQLSLSVHRALSNLFRSDSLAYDSLNLNTVNSANGVYYNSSPLSVQTNIPVGDTGLISITILDTTMLREWFSTNTDTTDLNDGLVIRPTNSNIIRGFYSFNVSDTSLTPTLFVNYVDTNGNSYTYAHKSGSSEYVATVNQASLITDNNLIFVQNGISYRGLISFDSISIPWPVSIHRAVLQVALNSAQSSPQNTPFAHDTMFALSVGINDMSDGGAYGISQRNDSSGHPIYSFDVRQIAIRMLSNASTRKIVLAGYDEATTFDLHTLYGAIPDKKLKPRIIITYSVQR